MKPEMVAIISKQDLELSQLVAEWVELPRAGDGHWFLHIAVTHGNGKVTEQWLTKHQAAEVAQVAGRKP